MVARYFLLIFYFVKAFEKLEELLKERGICLAVTAKLPKDSEVAKHDVYDKIVAKLIEKKKAKGEHLKIVGNLPYRENIPLKK